MLTDVVGDDFNHPVFLIGKTECRKDVHPHGADNQDQIEAGSRFWDSGSALRECFTSLSREIRPVLDDARVFSQGWTGASLDFD